MISIIALPIILSSTLPIKDNSLGNNFIEGFVSILKKSEFVHKEDSVSIAPFLYDIQDFDWLTKFNKLKLFDMINNQSYLLNHKIQYDNNYSFNPIRNLTIQIKFILIAIESKDSIELYSDINQIQDESLNDINLLIQSFFKQHDNVDVQSCSLIPEEFYSSKFEMNSIFHEFSFTTLLRCIDKQVEINMSKSSIILINEDNKYIHSLFFVESHLIFKYHRPIIKGEHPSYVFKNFVELLKFLNINNIITTNQLNLNYILNIMNQKFDSIQ